MPDRGSWVRELVRVTRLDASLPITTLRAKYIVEMELSH